jgi:hypothetical protein
MTEYDLWLGGPHICEVAQAIAFCRHLERSALLPHTAADAISTVFKNLWAIELGCCTEDALVEVEVSVSLSKGIPWIALSNQPSFVLV